MKKRFQWPGLRALLGVAAMGLVFWGCENMGAPTQPGGLDPRGYAIFSSTTGEQYVVIREAGESTLVSGTIGAAGGELHLGKHTLEIPAGAVAEPTVFSMGRADGDLVRIRLSATRDAHNDVGAAGFAAPVRLTLSFDSATDLPGDVTKLRVIYFQPDGLVAPQETYLNLSGHTASGDLPHFSDYGLAWPF